MKRSSFHIRLLLLLSLLSCGTMRHADRLRSSDVSLMLRPTDDSKVRELDMEGIKRDTLDIVEAEGNGLFFMKSLRDENGDVVASDVIKPSVVMASFKNVAERNGKVDLKFDIIIPAEMQDRKWQCRIEPVLYALDDTVALEDLLITGDLYRKMQIRGYRNYERYLSSIITDSASFVRKHDLDIFLSRQVKGLDNNEAVDHYTEWMRKRFHEYLYDNKDKVFNRLVKSPIIKEGLRLDTVRLSLSGDMIYGYVQTINVRQGMRKAEIGFQGGIWQEDKEIFTLCCRKKLTFYISSLSTLAEDILRFKKRVVERRVHDNSVCWIEFRQGRSELDPDLGSNTSEMERIDDNVRSVLDGDTYDLDSIVVTASCSPEGSFYQNGVLAQRRSESVSAFFRKLAPGVRFISRAVPENWRMLDVMVRNDTLLLPGEKRELCIILDSSSQPDAKENALSLRPSYRYLREQLYPRLRTVKFDFYLCRKGMEKDTIMTTVPDTLYSEGVRAIHERDYRKAVSILRPYDDINAAVACCAMNYDATALDILSRQKPSAKADYLKAVIFSRTGREREAVEAYCRSCSADGSFIHRGNLDPEISKLIQKYQIK